MSQPICTSTGRDELFARYVQDTLGPEERDAFEEHFFTCEACLDKVRTLQALQAQLRAREVEAPAARTVPARRWRGVLVPLAAGLVVVAAIWLRPDTGTPAPPESIVAEAPRQQLPAPATEVSPVEPAVQPPVSLGPDVPATPPAPVPVVPLSVLARVEPPDYIPLSLRGQRDEAAVRFEAAMRRYVDGDYAGAIPDLATAARLRPDGAHIAFFLAICQLLTDDVDAAIAGLQQTIALGDSPYLEESHYYLAKARLRQGDVAAARDELERTIEQHGRLESEARRLLEQLK